MHDQVIFAGVLRGMELFKCLHPKVATQDRVIKLHGFAGIVLKIDIGVEFGGHGFS